MRNRKILFSCENKQLRYLPKGKHRYKLLLLHPADWQSVWEILEMVPSIEFEGTEGSLNNMSRILIIPHLFMH